MIHFFPREASMKSELPTSQVLFSSVGAARLLPIPGLDLLVGSPGGHVVPRVEALDMKAQLRGGEAPGRREAVRTASDDLSFATS